MRARVVLHDVIGQKILLIHRQRAEQDYWVFPGGGVHADEIDVAGALREIREELGWTLHASELTSLFTLSSEREPQHYFYATVANRPAPAIHGEELDRSSAVNVYTPTWVSVTDLTSLNLAPAQARDMVLPYLANDLLAGSQIAPMTPEQAELMVRWQYPKPYTFYNQRPENYASVLAEVASSNFFVVTNANVGLIGFFEFNTSADGKTEIGLGLSPDNAGRGTGFQFVQLGLHYLRRTLNQYGPVVLEVADFNQRAQKVYARSGFKVVGQRQAISWGTPVTFIQMRR